MGKNSKIAWCDHSFNTWHGCTKVSEGCANCYAERDGKRFGWPQGDEPRKFFGEKHWDEPFKWNEAARKDGIRRKVFCASYGDVFENTGNDAVNASMDEARHYLWHLIEDTQSLDWLLLTKRPENVMGLIPWGWENGCWPSNCWLGVTAENQARADERIPELLRIPAPVRFVSVEPMLGPVDLEFFLHGCPVQTSEKIYVSHEMAVDAGDRSMEGTLWADEKWEQTCPPLSWVICGGESGPKARPMEADWVRGLRDQCQGAGVPFFFKQWSEAVEGSKYRYDPEACHQHNIARGLPILDGRTWGEFPEVKP